MNDDQARELLAIVNEMAGYIVALVRWRQGGEKGQCPFCDRWSYAHEDTCLMARADRLAEALECKEAR